MGIALFGNMHFVLMMVFHLFLTFSHLYEMKLFWFIKIFNFEQLIKAGWHFVGLLSAKKL